MMPSVKYLPNSFGFKSEFTRYSRDMTLTLPLTKIHFSFFYLLITYSVAVL